jgi:hypothetical protein
MTKEQRDAIRARLDAATPGPWEHTQDRDVVSTTVTAPMFDYRNEDGSLVFDDMTDYRVASLYYGHEGSHPWHDAELIANAPTDLRALLDEVERLRDVLLDTAVWCHAGHGDHPKSTCGLCRPIIEALRDKE